MGSLTWTWLRLDRATLWYRSVVIDLSTHPRPSFPALGLRICDGRRRKRDVSPGLASSQPDAVPPVPAARRTHDPVLSVYACELSGNVLGPIWRSVIYNDDLEVERAEAGRRRGGREGRDGELDVLTPRSSHRISDHELTFPQTP